MKQSEFSRIIGVSRQRVYRWIRDGILNDSVTKLGSGRKDIDLKKAKNELKINLNTAYDIKAKIYNKRGRPKKKVDLEPKRKKRTIRNPKPVNTEKIVEIGNYQDARFEKEKALALKHKFELDILQGKYVEVKAIKKAWTNHVSAAKTKLLGIRPELTPIVRETIEDLETAELILQAIDNKIEGILTELSRARI